MAIDNIEPYSLFSEIYDDTMKDVPYLQWASFIHEILTRFEISYDSLILDVGCGTGTLTRYLFSYYANIIGMDISFQMLEKASQKKMNNLVLGNMQNIPLKKSSISAMISTHDVLNYLLDEHQLHQHFSEAYRVLDKNGIYIFDASTEYNIIQFYHNKEFYEQNNAVEMRWSNSYDFLKKEILSTLEFKNKESLSSLFLRGLNFKQVRKNKKVLETHRQKYFSDLEIIKILNNTGFTLMEKVKDYNYNITGERVYLMVFICRKS